MRIRLLTISAEGWGYKTMRPRADLNGRPLPPQGSALSPELRGHVFIYKH